MQADERRFEVEGRRLKAILLLIVCILAVSLNSSHAAAQATGTTTIYQVSAPSEMVAGSQAPVTVSVAVYYNNTVVGYDLVVGVFDEGLSPPSIIPGVVVSSTDTCVNQPELAARCAIAVTHPSGVERVEFQIGGILGGKEGPGIWALNVTCVLVDNQDNLIPDSVSSHPFKINLTPVALNVTVPANVAVTVDGVSEPVGPVSVGVALGQHNLTVPQLVNITQFTRLRFDHWSDGNPSMIRTVDVTNSTTLQAFYVSQNLLTLIGVEGNTTISNWYDSDTNATFSTNDTAPMPGSLGDIGLTVSLKGWYENGTLLTTSPTGTISMDEPHSLTAVWQIDYSIPAEIAVATAAAVIILFLLNRRRRRSSARRRRRSKRVRRRS